MSNPLYSVALILLGALVGAVMTYLASYALERKKWSADATLRRREEIYGPIYDELGIKHALFLSFEDWTRSISGRLEFDSWDRVRHTSLALEIPQALVVRLDQLRDAFKIYSSHRGSFYSEARLSFPGRHEDFDDYGVAIVLGEKMLVAPQEGDLIAIQYLRSQRSTARDMAEFWTKEELETARSRIAALQSWSPMLQAHEQLKTLVSSMHDECHQRW
jgi:hypothetical protein